MAEYRGDILLSQGLNAGVNRLLGAMDKRKEEEKNRARMFKGLVELLDTSGIMTKDEAITRSVEELDAVYKGTVLKQQMAEMTGLPKFYEALAQQAQAQALQPDPMAMISSGGQAQGDQSILGLIAAASRQSGYSPQPQNLDDIIRAIGGQQQPVLPLGKAIPVEGGGRLIGTGGPTAQFVQPQQPEVAASTMGKILQDLNAAQAAGDEKAVALLTMAAEKSATAQNVSLGWDDQGRPIINMGPAKPTVATASKLQQSQLMKKQNLSLIRQIKEKLRPEHVGVHGLLGEVVVDSGMAQVIRALGGTPAVNNDRIEVRELMRMLREGSLRELTQDTVLNKDDRKRVEEIVDATRAAKSYDQVVQQLDTLEAELSSRALRAGETLGEPATFAMTLQELYDAGKAGVLTPAQVEDALVNYHGYRRAVPPPQRATDLPAGPPRMENPSRGQMMRY